MDLFSANQKEETTQAGPLAERARPQQLDQFFGQSKFNGPDSLLSQFVESKKLPNLIFWGPPGCGKTTAAHILAKAIPWTFVNCSAIDTGAKDLKALGEEAKNRLFRLNEKTLIFIDEIHRLNRAQQDCLLPYIEKGFFTLIGATTENPSFELNSAVLSRCQVIVFESLDEKALSQLLDRGLELLDDNQDWDSLANFDVKEWVISRSGGDGRRALNILENLYRGKTDRVKAPLDQDKADEIIQFQYSRYDKNKEMHYDIISAFIKSIRGSDPDGALYYLARMLKGGEDPVFIARRLVILASEDVGNADPRALQVAVAVKEAVQFVGMPEARINLAQGVTYLASCPKSNRSYMGINQAMALVDKHPELEVPHSIRNAPTKLMKDLGYGGGYQYAHDAKNGVTDQQFLPNKIKNITLYEPSTHGFEKNIKAYLDWIKAQKQGVKKK